MRIHLAAGLSAMEAGNLDRAAAIATSARDTLPQYWDAWVMSGKVALRQEKYAEAVAFMARAHELWPSIYTQRQLAEAVVARNLAALQSQPTTLPALP
jgi:tetratricopeptide (TPR) repeat protein